MNESISPVSRRGTFPRLLIAADHASTLEPLLCTFQDDRIDVDFDLCTSQANTLQKLTARPYQLIIASAHLAEINDFFLLRCSQSSESFVPFVVTAGTSEKQAAARALAQGAFDLIFTPFDHEQTVSTIRLALWSGQLRKLIASKERMVEKCRQHLADYPGDRTQVGDFLSDALSAFERTMCAVDQSLLRVEESAARLSDLAMIVEQDARRRAFAHLDRLATLWPNSL